MPQDELAAWLRLALTPGVGNGAARRLLARFGQPGAIFSQSTAALQNCVHASQAAQLHQHPPGWDTALDTAWTWLQNAGAAEAEGCGRALIPLGDPRYPPALLQMEAPPLMLYALGPAALRPCTVAVVGTGIDRVYPRSHQALAHAIVRQGFILSEYPLGTPPLAANFPKRNRLIAGLSAGTLVVEAAVASGSLITARLAAEQGREVFAIPGSIHAPQAKGCHTLLREGAKLVESVQDILEELPAARQALDRLTQAASTPTPT
ncbi:DNA-processing protein DprA, partial [Comamonas terrigena]|uniref:DNA-processing protein DprA n=1 Tax=Comamonas terrigena TaxID=32013 RepID=UPI0028A6167B